MSREAYLDNIETKTGKSLNTFITLAKEKGYDNSNTKAGVIMTWLKEEFGLGHGHAMALMHAIKNGAKIDDK
jgi:hypothetical protein